MIDDTKNEEPDVSESTDDQSEEVELGEVEVSSDTFNSVNFHSGVTIGTLIINQ